MTSRPLASNLPFVALAVFLVLGTAIASLLFARLTQERLDSHNQPFEDITWPLFQVQAEYYRVRLLVAEALANPADAARDAALERYEVLISRLPVVTESNIQQRLAQYPHLRSLTDQIVETLLGVDAAVQGAASPAERVLLLRRRLAEMADLAQRMVVAAHLTLTNERSEAATALHQTHTRLAGLFGGVALAVLAFAVVCWRQFRRLEQSRAALVALSHGLAAEKERAVMASQAKSTFLANMSHELRTPLNAIIGFAEMIAVQTLGPISPPRYAEYAADIRRSGQHLLSLVNDLLDLARIEAGRMTIEPEWLALRAACAASIATFEADARRRGVALERSQVDAELRLLADSRALQQMLLNLLSNALKFTPAGGEIEIACEVSDTALRLLVRDSGVGFAPDLMQHFMEPFARGAAKAVDGQQGTGLGLSITRRLMELHGGRLELESAVGRGTTAILVFPASAAAWRTGLPATTAVAAAAA